MWHNRAGAPLQSCSGWQLGMSHWERAVRRGRGNGGPGGGVGLAAAAEAGQPGSGEAGRAATGAKSNRWSGGDGRCRSNRRLRMNPNKNDNLFI